MQNRTHLETRILQQYVVAKRILFYSARFFSIFFFKKIIRKYEKKVDKTLIIYNVQQYAPLLV